MRCAIKIGTAGWSIPAHCADAFPGQGSHLERYARRLTAVEINSCFYRSHKPSTYLRWAASVPADFRFAVKLPREITHNRKLVGALDPLVQFLSEIEGLGERLGPLLVQLPPSLYFDFDPAERFFNDLRARFVGYVVCEPRHPSWFTEEVDALLTRFRIARVAADPAPVTLASEPAGWPGLVYRRLHGSPRMYYSSYSDEVLESVAAQMLRASEEVEESWCIFDNTALGAACENALSVLGQL